MTGQTVTPVVHAIDFGTSTSMIMVGRPADPPLLVRDPAAARGEVGIPTSVCSRRDGSLAVGYEAERVKRIRIQDYRSGFKLEIGQPVNHRLGNADYSPDQLMAAVIKFLREQALASVAAEPDLLLVTVPVAWEERTQDLTVRACVAAGYDAARVRLENEPVAAMNGLGRLSGTTVIYDLGGGTFDCAVALDSGSGPRIFGDPFGLPHVGGRAFDERILRHLRDTYPQAAKIFAADTDDEEALRRAITLREKCTQAKIELSVTDPYEELLSELDPQELFLLNRAALSGLIGDLMEQTVDECERMLHALDLSWSDVNQCVLIGGSSRMPMVRHRMEERIESPVRTLEEPELAVVRGATELALGIVAPSAPPQPSSKTIVGSAASTKAKRVKPATSAKPAEPIDQKEAAPSTRGAGLQRFRPDRNLFEEM